MSIHNKDLAFSHLPGSLSEFPSAATNNVLYRFESGGTRYIMKELKPDSQYWRLGSNATEVAGAMNIAYKIVKKHYGDKFPDTSYIVMNSREGKPTVVTLQREIKGKSLWQEVQDGDGDDAVRCNHIVNQFDDIWKESVFYDHDWRTLSEEKKSFFTSDISLKQIVHTPDNKYVLVDF